MKKEMNLTYKTVANISSDEVQRRVEAAFNVLFDSVFEDILPLQAEAPIPNVSTSPKEALSWQIRR